MDLRFDRGGTPTGVVFHGVFAFVNQTCVLDFVARTRGAVGLVDVVTGVDSGCSPGLFAWPPSVPPSVATLCSSWRFVSIVVSNFIIDFCRRCFLFLGSAMMASRSLLWTASTHCVGLRVGSKQCWGNKLYDPDVRYPPVLGTNTFILR